MQQLVMHGRCLPLSFRVFLCLCSFFIYAFAVLHQGHYLIAKCANECGTALPAAISFSVYGDRLGTYDDNVKKEFFGTPSSSIDRTNRGNIPQGQMEMAFDGTGIGYIIFASVAMKLFGPNMVALPLGLLSILAISTIAFVSRFRDDRLLIVPLVFFALSFMLITWQNTDSHSINQGFIGGYRYTVILALLPSIHIILEILDQPENENLILKLSLLAVQSSVLAFALIVRSSTAYVLVAFIVAAVYSLSRSRNRNTIWSTAQIAVCGTLVSGLILGSMIGSMPVEYVQTGRVFGTVWHRIFISLSMHAAWPYGHLTEMFPCPKDRFPQGIASPRWDNVGWCAWWASNPKSMTGRQDDAADDPNNYYDSTYEKTLRADFFRVLFAYPKEVIETFYYDKSIMLLSTLRDSLTITWSDVPPEVFPLFLLQCTVFFVFVIVSAFSTPLRGWILFPIVSGLLALAPIPGYIAWHTVDGVPDLIALMYAFFGLSAAYFLQGSLLALARRTRIPIGVGLSGLAIMSLLAMIFAINFYDFGEISHPLIAPHPWPRLSHNPS